MIVVLALFGRELLRLDVAFPEPAAAEEASEQTVAHRHSGEFGFGASPARPYWTADPEELPAVV